MIRTKSGAAIAILSAFILISATSCDPSNKLEKQEKEQMDAYLSENSTLNFVKQPSGLYYAETLAGTGTSPALLDSAWVKYTGKFVDGTVFDSNVVTGKLYAFIVGQNIVGFDEGVLLMKPGGKATLLIPSKLGYGTAGNYSIPGYTPLVFDIELVKVVPKAN